MRRVRSLAIVVVALALAACASPPLVWHTLVKPALGAHGEAANAQGEAPGARADGARGATHVFEFAMPGVPVQVDRAELVLTDGAARQVRVLEGERWLAPLPEEVRAALSRGYARASGARDATGLARPQGVPLLRVRTMLRRFEIGGGQAVVDAEWSLQLAGDGARDSPLCWWSANGMASGAWHAADTRAAHAADVRAAQELLATLAGVIAGMGSAWVADASTPCPASANPATVRG